MKTSKSLRQTLTLSLFLGASLLCATVTAEAQTPGPLHLAYGDLRSTAQPNASHTLVVRDLHDDHYHNFTQNNGTDPEGHVPMPLQLLPGGSSSVISFGGMDISPYPTETMKFISTNRYEGPLETLDLRLEVVSISSPDLKIGIFEWHDDHFHNEGFLTAGSSFSLEYNGWYEFRFSLEDGASLDNYSAVFRLVDAQTGEGITPYGTSANFTVHAEAIPEPSTVILLVGAAGLLAVRRIRSGAHRA